MKKFTSSFNLIVLNTTNFSNPFHGQTSLKDTLFSVLKSGAKLLLIGLRIGLRLVLRVIFSQYGIGLPAVPVALLVPGVNTSLQSYRSKFKSFVYIKI